jgi:hypothetical protein
MEHIPVPQRPPPQPKGFGPEAGASQIGKDDALAPPVWGAAGTLNCFDTSIVPHFGQWATSLELRIRVSNVWSHGAQRYS